MHGNFKRSRNVHVVLEVYERKGEESVDWKEQDMDLEY